MEASTLSTHKSAFLLSQIRLLSTPLQPSATFTHSLTTSPASDPSVPSKTLDELITKLNEKLSLHNRSVFSAQSQRHIVEQIESLYFTEALADPHPTNAETAQGEEVVAIERDVDLTATDAIAGFPEELTQAMLHDTSDLGMDEGQADQYYALRKQLLEAAEKRDQARERVRRYERLRVLLSPFENASESVQGNLVTRDGELGREMERMRVLVARAVGRMAKEGDELVKRDAKGERGESKTFDEKLAMVMEVDTT